MRVLSRLFRRLLLTGLQQAFDDGQLRFSGTLDALADGEAFASHLAPARQVEWVVYAKAPFAGPSQVLDYVGRYTHRVALSNHRLLDLEHGQVRFHYKDYRAPSAHPKAMTLTATEFIRRFLLHTLPPGFHRIRYYGFLGNRTRREQLVLCRRLLATPDMAPTPDAGGEPVADAGDRVAARVEAALRICPICAAGVMRVLDLGLGTRARPVSPDTS